MQAGMDGFTNVFMNFLMAAIFFDRIIFPGIPGAGLYPVGGERCDTAHGLFLLYHSFWEAPGGMYQLLVRRISPRRRRIQYPQHCCQRSVELLY